MQSVFKYLNYRQLLADRASIRKKARAGWTLHRLASQAGLHPPFLTNVLKERAHLNADQLYALARALDLTDEEGAFALLLLEYERSAHAERRERLRTRIEGIAREKNKTDAHLSAPKVEATTEEITRFYINPELQLVHAFLGVERFARRPALIGRALNIDAGTVEALVRELIELGYARETPAGLEKTRKSLHLPKESPLCAPQQLLMQYRALQHQQLLPESSRYNFAVTFTADDGTREKIHAEFLQFLSRIEKWVREAPSAEVYQLRFDLFPWSRS